MKELLFIYLQIAHIMFLSIHTETIKNRQSMTGYTLLGLLLLRIIIFNHAGPEDVTKQNFCQTLQIKENYVSGKFQRSVNKESKSADFVEGLDSIVTVTFTHSLRRAA